MKRFEDSLRSIEPGEPRDEVRERVLDGARAALPATPPPPATTTKRKRNALAAFATSRWFLLGALPLLLLTTAGLCAVVLDGRGADYHWRSIEEQLAAAGETLELDAFVPAPVPDADNFMATPALRAIEDGRLPHDPALEAKRERIYALPRIAPPHEAGGADATGDPAHDLAGYQVWEKGGSRDDARRLDSWPGQPEQTLLDLTGVDAALWDELAAAARRTHSQPVVPVTERIGEDPAWSVAMSQLQPLQLLTKTATLRAVAAARLGDRQTAVDSLAIALKCRDAAIAEPSLICGLVGVACGAILEARLPQVLAADCLTAADLVWLQGELARHDPHQAALRMFRSEMAFVARLFDDLIAMRARERIEVVSGLDPADGGARFDMSTVLGYLLPDSFYLRNKATSIQWWFRYNLVPFKNLDIDALRTSSAELEAITASTSWFSYSKALAKLTAVPLGAVGARAVGSIAQHRMLITAVALERFRLDHGSFPDALDALVPQYLEAVPADTANPAPGALLGYHPDDDRSGYTLDATPMRPEDVERRPQMTKLVR